jgi:hypothetical protein
MTERELFREEVWNMVMLDEGRLSIMLKKAPHMLSKFGLTPETATKITSTSKDILRKTPNSIKKTVEYINKARV